MPAPQNPNTHFHFILACFCAQDIDDVIQDITSVKDGYNFLYSLDTYDIVENYLPYMEIKLFSNKGDRNFQAQKFICYDYFFGALNRTNCILLNEYKIELVAAKNKLNKVLNSTTAVIKNLVDLKKETDNFLTKPEKTEEFIKNNFEVVLLLLILNDKSYSILQEFFAFIKERLNVTDIPVLNIRHREFISEIFATTYATGAATQVFKQYVENNREKLIVEQPAQRHIFLENTYRDIQAIERSFQINEKLLGMNSNYCLRYLSSAKKTVDIIKLLNDKQQNASEAKQRTFHRNIYQYFLFDRLKHEYKGNLQTALDILVDLKELLSQLGEKSSQPDERVLAVAQNELMKTLTGLFDVDPNIVENRLNFSVYEKYENTFKKILDGKASGHLPVDDLTQIINEVNKNKNLYESKIYALENRVSQLRLEYDVIETFWNIDDFEPDYRPGRDIIRNPYQHLPNLLFVGDSFNTALKDKLYKFLNLSVEVTEDNKVLLKKYVKQITDELYFRNDDTVNYKTLRALIFTYLNFVAQSKFKPSPEKSAGNNEKHSEDRIILELEHQYELVRFQYEKIDYSHIEVDERLSYIQSNQELLNEINYLLLWLYRRNEREQDAIERFHMLDYDYAHTHDPRIFQGIGLCYVAAAYRKVEKHPDEPELIRNDIDLALQFMKSSQFRYQELINENSNAETSKLIVKNYIAVLNTVADMSIRKYELPTPRPDMSLIETARECISEIKILFDTIDLLYDQHPTYLATEIEVEYFEAANLYDRGKISSAHEKIIDASQHLLQLKNLPDTVRLVGNVFLKKAERVNKLASTIFLKINKR